MGRIVTAVLGFSLLAAAAWYSLHHTTTASATADGPSGPKRQLDNVRESARRIESDADQRAEHLDETMKIAQ